MLPRVLSKLTPFAYFLLRAATGLLFAMHGAKKVFGVLGADPVSLTTQVGVGGLIELVCGLAIAVGLFTPWAAFLASGTMAVAYVQFHWKLQMGAALLPPVNGGEAALIYCLLFFYVACRGGGAWSVDAMRRRG